MEEYKKTLITRHKIYLLALSVIVIFFSVNRFLDYGIVIPNPHTADFVHGLFAGTAFGVEILLVVGIFQNVRALKDEKKLEELYIAENDERTAYIKNKIGGDFATYMTIFQLVVAIGLAFVDIRFTFVLYAVTILECIVRIIMKAWYMKNI